MQVINERNLVLTQGGHGVRPIGLFNDSRRIMEAIEAEPREIGESSSPLKNTLHMVHRALSIDELPHDEVDPIKIYEGNFSDSSGVYKKTNSAKPQKHPTSSTGGPPQAFLNAFALPQPWFTCRESVASLDHLSKMTLITPITAP